VCGAHSLRHKRAFRGEAAFGIERQLLFDLSVGATKTNARAIFRHVKLDVLAAPESVRYALLYGRHSFHFAAPARAALPQSQQEESEEAEVVADAIQRHVRSL
jgi:hypothetical protein